MCGRPHHRLTVTLHRDSAEQYKQKRFFLSLNTPTRTLAKLFISQAMHCNEMLHLKSEVEHNKTIRARPRALTLNSMQALDRVGREGKLFPDATRTGVRPHDVGAKHARHERSVVCHRWLIL